MNKALITALLLLLTVSIAGQKPQPTAKRSKTTQPTKQTSKAKPEPTPVDPEADRKRFDEAVAASTAAEKARLLRAFIDRFPESESREEAFTYLITARAVVGNELIQAGDTAAGIASFKLAVEEAPLPVPDRLFNDVILKIPGTLFYSNQRLAAMELARLMEKKFAASPKQLLGVAAFYLGIENGSEAKRVAEAAIAVDPNSAAAYQALGLANRLNFDLEESAKAYAKAAELDANSVSAKRSLAEMNRALGKPEDAAATYREILVSNENDAIARQGLILSLFDNGQQKEAESELAKTLQSEPRNFALLTSVAYWYAAHEQADRAVEHAQKAVDIEPRYIWGHIVLARGLMKQNKPVDAERALLRARQYGNFPTLDYEIASARFQAGLYREAVEELQKSFSLKDGLIGTRLGGRVYKEEKNFQDLIAHERKASLLQPSPADSIETSEKLRLLFELTRKLEQSADESELTALADEFVKGGDKMKLHRQLYVANLFLQKNIALPKVAELVKASVGNADAGLDVAAPGAAVMAGELYESRTIALSRNEVILIPEVSRQMLSAILRGRIEELAGWTAFQQKNYPEAVTRLKRSITVLPEKSAWWRSSVWRLGAALEADGKDKEALDNYIKSYVTDRPSAVRYGVIEALYRKVNGSIDGLEEKIGSNPLAAVASSEPKPVEQTKKSIEPEPNAIAKNVPAVEPPPVPAEPVRRFPRHVPVQNIAARPEQDKSAAAAKPDIVDAKPESGSNMSEASAAPATPESQKNAEKPKPKVDDVKTDTTAATAILPEQKPAANSVTVTDIEPAPGKDQSKSSDGKTDSTALPPTIPAAEVKESKVTENEKEISPAPPKHLAADQPAVKTAAVPVAAEKDTQSVKDEKDTAAVKQSEVKEKAPEPDTVPQVLQKDQNEPPKGGENTAGKETSTEPKSVPENIKAEVEPVKQDVSVSRTDPPKDEKASVPDRVQEPTDNRDVSAANDQPEPKPEKTEPVNLLREPFANASTESAKSTVPESAKPPEKVERKSVIIINDPFKAAEKAPKPKDLFEPIIIKVPGGPPAKTPAGGSETQTGTTRRRVVEGKEIVSDQQCSIVVSQDSIMLLSGGGSLGLLVRINGSGEIEDVTASSGSPRDIDVRPEPEIDGITGRRFFVIKSITDKTGIFQVNFESPCGKREITVHVR